MTPEARLDRLERMAMLLVRAGFRARSELRDRDREHDKKINHLIDLQIHNEELQKQNEERFARNEERFARNEERFNRDEAKVAALSQKTDQRFLRLADSQTRTERNLGELIRIVRRLADRNPQTDS